MRHVIPGIHFADTRATSYTLNGARAFGARVAELGWWQAAGKERK